MSKSKSLRRAFQKDQPTQLWQTGSIQVRLSQLCPSHASRVRAGSRSVTQVTEINSTVAYYFRKYSITTLANIYYSLFSFNKYLLAVY